MELQEAITLINTDTLPSGPSTWADLGCGKGLFTEALYSLLHPASKIYAVDQYPVKLHNPAFIPVQLDFVKDNWPMPPLDGILMANSLHFVEEKAPFLHKLKQQLKENGQVLIVEYDTDIPNPYVPYPVSHPVLRQLFHHAGFENIRSLGKHPSIYSKTDIYAVLID